MHKSLTDKRRAYLEAQVAKTRLQFLLNAQAARRALGVLPSEWDALCILATREFISGEELKHQLFGARVASIKDPDQAVRRILHLLRKAFYKHGWLLANYGKNTHGIPREYRNKIYNWATTVEGRRPTDEQFQANP